MSILEFSAVSRMFGKTEVLRDINLQITEPCVYGLIGRNGAGKTTLLRMIPCLLHPSRGDVRVFGKDPWDHQEEIKKRMGYLSEEDQWPPTLRARDLLDAYASVLPRWDKKMAGDLIERFGLDPSKRFAVLSKGERRQVGLLCAVCHHPELLVLDEPAGGLDPVVRRRFLQVVIELLAEAGSTVLFSSHQFADVERLAQRVGILHEGRLIADTTLTDLQERSCRALIAGGDEVADRLREQPECLRVTRHNEAWLVTLRCTPDEAPALVRQRTGGEVREIQTVDLEELFIDWMGGPE